MMYLIAYDIGSDKIRSKVARRLTAEGFERIQLSVFSGIVHPKAVKGLWQDLQTWLKQEKSAKLYVLKLTKNNFRSMEIIGPLDWDIDYLLGDQNSIFV